jgi:hypothetical protein
MDKGQRVPTITSAFYHYVFIDIAYDDDDTLGIDTLP